MKEPYKIISSDCLGDLEVQVNHACKDGYRPLGSIAVAMRVSGRDGDVGSDTTFYQAVIYSPRPKDSPRSKVETTWTLTPAFQGYQPILDTEGNPVPPGDE